MKPWIKNTLFFIAGMITTILIIFILGLIANNYGGITGLKMFQEKGECITKGSIEVFQVLAPDAALAHTKSNYGYNGKVILVVNNNGKTYYDEQVISAKNCFRQIGTYEYETKSEFRKVVPVVIAE